MRALLRRGMEIPTLHNADFTLQVTTIQQTQVGCIVSWNKAYGWNMFHSYSIISLIFATICSFNKAAAHPAVANCSATAL